MSLPRLDFDTLNQLAGYQAWNSTFAYWLLVLHDPNSSYELDADEAQATMSFQFEVEEQATTVADIASDSDLIPAIFTPIAPVTLALHWSPFPTAIKILGSPVHSHAHQGSVLATFTSQIIPATAGTSSDERHFDFLLREACARAATTNALVLLVGSPGWSYDHEDYLASQPEVQQLMREFGFVYTLRKPAGN